MRKTILFPRKRIASRALQEKSQVKTRCVRVGSTRLYAPMVPLAPHPCVRWWNTEEMPLKLTRLGLHSLKGGSPNELPPPRRRGYQRTWYGIPLTQRQWRKGGPRVAQTQAAGNRKIAQSLSLKGYPSRVGALCGCTAARNHFHWSTFSFSESRTAFSFASKRKSGFGPQPGRQKTNCKIKHPP